MSKYLNPAICFGLPFSNFTHFTHVSFFTLKAVSLPDIFFDSIMRKYRIVVSAIKCFLESVNNKHIFKQPGFFEIMKVQRFLVCMPKKVVHIIIPILIDNLKNILFKINIMFGKRLMIVPKPIFSSILITTTTSQIEKWQNINVNLFFSTQPQLFKDIFGLRTLNKSCDVIFEMHRHLQEI